ncbi:MAG: flagellar biosynthesis protein FlgA [Clostridium sp.]|nr:flagellar biosynthesis protein FlgA [Clostridium sp.]
MKINSIRDIKPGRQFPKRFFAVVICIIIVAVSFVILSNADSAAKDTVDIIRIKPSAGVPANTLLTSSMIEKYSIIRKEYTEDMVAYEEIDDVLDKYTLYYMRSKSPIFLDQLTTEKPLKNEWLYELDESNEVLTLPYNYLNCGGDILTPGDVVRIRVSFNDKEDTGDPELPGSREYRRLEVLFDSITVRDLLNNKGHSIYEVYKEVFKLGEEQRQKVMKSNEFMENILPRALILEGTKAQSDNYAKYSDDGDARFTITILSRKGNENIMDQLPTIEKEVESWIQQKE